MLIDTHLHLDAVEFEGVRECLWQAAQLEGVKGGIVPGVCPQQWPRMEEVVRDFPGLVAAWGVHPLFVDTAHAAAEEMAGCPLSDEEGATVGVSWVRAQVARAGGVAIGEIGLDRWAAQPSWPRQVAWFEAQLRVAVELGLPVVIHARRAVEEVRQRVRRVRGLQGGIVHAFNGSIQQAEDLAACGFALGFGGAMTFRRSGHLRRLIRELPLTAVVLETDAPDIAPAWGRVRPQRQSLPGDLVAYATLVAEWRGVEIEEVAATTTANALRVIPALGAQLKRAEEKRQRGERNEEKEERGNKG